MYMTMDNILKESNIFVEPPIQRSFFARESCFNMLQINIRGMNNIEKLDSLAIFIDNLGTPVDILIICETCIKQDRSSFYNMNGFSSIHSCRTQSAGGLAVYVRNGIGYDIISNSTIDGYHHINLQIPMDNSVCSIHGIHRPPDFDFVRFRNLLEEILASSNLSKPIFIFGDMNVAINRDRRDKEEYMDLLQSYGMIVTNTNITRPESDIILDHSIARIDDIIRTTNYTISCDFSDHNYVVQF